MTQRVGSRWTYEGPRVLGVEFKKLAVLNTLILGRSRPSIRGSNPKSQP